MNEYPDSSSDDEGDEYENNDHNQQVYSSEDEDNVRKNQAYKKKIDHQLEWDDAAIEYGPKKV